MFDIIQISDNFANSFTSSLIEFDVAELFILSSRTLSKSMFASNVVAHAEINYDEESDSNKCSFMKKSRLIFAVSEFVDENDRCRRKEQKQVVKKMKSQSVVEMFNKILEKYDTSISIRQILKTNKVNIS